jgi:hypothetical protein
VILLSGGVYFMEYIKNILDDFELIKTFVISLTMLITVILFCLNYIWNHIKEFKKNRQGKE